MQSATAPEHILLTALGLRAQETTYSSADGRKATAGLAPLALLQLLDPSDLPTRVFALVTEDARRETWPLFREEVHRLLDVEPEALEIPNGKSPAEVEAMMEIIADEVPSEVELSLDVTQGFRHFPFIMYALALYLQTLRNVRIRGAYYGMLEASLEDGSKAIINLRPLLELPEWFYAVRTFRETGATSPMARLATPLAEQLRAEAVAAGNDTERHMRATAAKEFLSRLDEIGFAFAAGLPLELGKAATLLCQDGEHAIPAGLRPSLPLGNEISQQLADAAAQFRFPAPPTWGGTWKAKLQLNEDELSRQADLIDSLLQRNLTPVAIGLLQEWVVSWLILQEGDSGEWLGYYQHRRRAANKVNAVSGYVKDSSRNRDSEELPADAKEWGDFWHQLTELRNTLHHHGMREQLQPSRPKSLEKLVSFWQRIRGGNVRPPTLGGGGGCLLITALGQRPGVLHSALKATHPDRCLVICSENSKSPITQVAAEAGITGSIEQLIVSDPHAGFEELPGIRAKSRRWLLDADRVVANLTGGTTLMGVLVQQLVESAQQLDRPTRRLALIDRRTPDEQESDPYVASEHHWLDPEETGNDND